MVGSCGDRPKRTEPSNVTRHAAAQRSETRDADSRSRAAAEPRASSHAPGPHDHRGRLPNSGSVNTPREWTHRDGGTPALPHPSASKRSLHVRRHASHVYSWSGKGFTAGSYCPDKGVRSGSMFALPALTVLTGALLRSASEWSNSLHPDLNAVMNPQAAPHWELARHAAIVAQGRGVLYQLVVDGWMLRIFRTSGERPKRDCRRSATEGRFADCPGWNFFSLLYR